MIEVTFKFDSIEKAIATLGSLMKGAAPVPNIENPAKPEGGTVDKKRKPRADAGKPRGSYKDNGATVSEVTPAGAVESAGGSRTAEGEQTPPSVAPPETAAPEAPAEADNAQPSGEVPTAAAATQEQAQAALEALFAAKGLPAAQAAMAQFGVSRLRDMKPEDYGPFVAAAQEAAK
jgi:hypothetical protein